MLFDRPRHYLILAWGIVFTIIILSLLPSSSLPKLHWVNHLQIDKIIHFGFYGSAAWSFSKYFKTNNESPHYWRIGTFLLILGIVLECLQYLMKQGRSFDLKDILANAIGIFCGIRYFDDLFSTFSKRKETDSNSQTI